MALGAGAATARQTTTETEQVAEREALATFQATATGGFITLNSDDPDPPGDGDGLRIDLDPDQDGVEGDIEIEGTVYDDMTWEAGEDDISFPEIDITALVDDEDLPIEPSDDEIEIIPEPIEGTYDPDTDGGLMTGGIALTIDVWLEFLGSIEREFQVKIPGETEDPIPVTTDESNNMEGSAENLDSEGTEFTLVSNDFIVEETGEVIDNPIGDDISLDEELGLPAEPPDENWAEFEFEDVEWLDEPPEFGPGIPPIVGTDPPQDINGDGLFEDITGSGDTGIVDTQALFDNLSSADIQDNAEAFNFSDASPDDEVTILDVAAHWRQHVY